MRAPHPLSRRFVRAPLVFTCLALVFVSGAKATAATLGFVEKFPGVSIQGWGGGALEANPGTGGTDGAGDGYLNFKSPNGFQHNLGVRSSETPYLGNWTTANIKQVRLWLNDVGADDPLEMHFSVGTFTNLWQYNPGFLPPHGQWAEYVVDVTNAANWTRIVGTSTFANALLAVEVVHVRHDHAPFVQNPDDLDADVGLDRVLLTDGLVDVPVGSRVPRSLELAAPMPNPSRGEVTLSFEQSEAGPVRIEIMDASGRRVRQVVLADAGSGARSWAWDGRGANGRTVPPGYYQVRMTGRSGGMSRGLVRIE